MGLLAYLPNDDYLPYVYLAVIARAIIGYGESLVQTAVFSLTAQSFPDSKTEYIGYLETGLGVGMIMGPPLSSFIYGFVGYSWTMYIFGSMNIVNFLQFLLLLP